MVGREHAVVQDGVGPRRRDECTQPGEKGGGHLGELARWNAGERDVVFPAGTVRMRLRHKVLTEPVPLDLLLTA